MGGGSAGRRKREGDKGVEERERVAVRRLEEKKDGGMVKW